MRTRLLHGAWSLLAVAPLLALAASACSCTEAKPVANATAPVPAPAKPPHQEPAQPVDLVPALSMREKFPLPPAHCLGREAQMGEFTVIAINRYWAGPAPVVLTLDDAMESGACAVHESGQQGWVTAAVEGKVPVFALIGDLLFGGAQDRMLASSVVLEPGLTSVPVFAAETWNWPVGNEPEQKPMHRYSDCPQVDLNVKAAIYQAGDQASVSSAIAQVARKLNVPDALGRGAYRSAYDTPQAAAIGAMVAKARGIMWAFTLGFVVYKGDKLIAADLFDSTRLLEELAEDLLAGYAMTAIYGDVAHWEALKPVEPAPDAPLEQPLLPEPPKYRTPFTYDPPTATNVIVDDDLIRRECRRSADSSPIHIGLFRRQ